jgi:hypothetical protein
LLELQKCFTCKNNRINPLFSFCFIPPKIQQKL